MGGERKRGVDRHSMAVLLVPLPSSSAWFPFSFSDARVVRGLDESNGAATARRSGVLVSSYM